MTERIVIEGGIARHERIETIAETALSLLEPHLTRYEATTFPVLPRGTVHLAYDRNNGRGHLLVEQPPTRHTIAVRHHGRYPDDRRPTAQRNPQGADLFTVQFPYTYFAFTFALRVSEDFPAEFAVDGNMMFWRPLPITTDADLLYPAACPNVDAHGGICWGGTLNNTEDANLPTRINAIVNSFAHTDFNEDLGHRTPFGTSLTEWETNSADPLAYMTWDYWDEPTDRTDHRGHAFPLSDLARNLGRDPLPIAQINPSHVNLPSLPPNFTVGRARELIAAMPEGQRRRFIAALRERTDDPLNDLDVAPEETEAVPA